MQRSFLMSQEELESRADDKGYGLVSVISQLDLGFVC